MTRENRALGAFYGLALGDALGMPTQSLSREQVQKRFGAITALEDADADQQQHHKATKDTNDDALFSHRI